MIRTENAFIPKRLQRWKPGDRSRRRCHWCVKGPLHVSGMVKVLEGPMHYHFCAEGCCFTWHARRHDDDALVWLRMATGTRAKLLKEGVHAPA